MSTQHDTSRVKQKERDKYRLIIHLSDTIAQVASGQPISKPMKNERAKLVARALWPPGLGITTDATPEELSQRSRDFFQGKLSMLDDG